MMEMTDINQLADDTAKKLSELWDEIGVEEDERNEALVKIKAEVSLVFANALKAETANRDLLTQNILRLVNSLLMIAGALGENVQMDESIGQLPLRLRYLAVKEKLDSFEKRKLDRVEELASLHKEINSLWSELGSDGVEALRVLGTDLALERVNHFKEQIQIAKLEKSNRTTQIKNLTVEILELWEELAMPADTEFDKSILRGDLKPSLHTISLLEEKKVKLIEEKHFRENEIKKHAKQISALWAQLKIQEAQQEEFFNRHTGLGPNVLEAVRLELKRLEELKAASMKQLIGDAREKLNQLWNEIHLSTEERQHFNLFTSNEYTEEVLQAHQVEINKMNDKLKEYRPIISLIGQRESLCKERLELDNAAADPNRLLSKERNQAARLLKEEKLRKTIAKDLPKIEEKLKTTLVAWEKQYNQLFLWNGRRYLEVLDSEAEAERRRKDDERVRREQNKANRYGTITNRENTQPHSTMAARDLRTPTKAVAVAMSGKMGTLKTPASAIRTPGIREANVNAQQTPSAPAISPNPSTQHFDA